MRGVYNSRMHRSAYLLAFFWSAVMAQDRALSDSDEKLKAKWEQQFRAADKNNDRALDRAEAEAGLPKVLSRNFDRIDLNADGRITPEELWAMHEREVVEREKRRAERVSGPPR